MLRLITGTVITDEGLHRRILTNVFFLSLYIIYHTFIYFIYIFIYIWLAVLVN